MKNIMKRIMKVIMYVAIVLLVIAIIVAIAVRPSNGTFTNKETKSTYSEVDGYVKYEDEENGISFLYPEYLEINVSNEDNVRIHNASDDGHIVGIRLEVNENHDNVHIKDVFNPLHFELYKLLFQENEVDNRKGVVKFYFNLEKVNGKKTIVSYGEIETNNDMMYELTYHYANDNESENIFSIITTDKQVFDTVVGSIDY